MHNEAIHESSGVDLELVREVVEKELSDSLSRIEQLLDAERGSSGRPILDVVSGPASESAARPRSPPTEARNGRGRSARGGSLRAPFDPEAPDEALAGAACEGDARAFEALLRRHEGRVLRLLRLLGVPANDREDVAQEVFLRVFRHLNGFDRARPFSAWVYRLTVNAAHDYRHRAVRVEEATWPADFDPAGEGKGAEEAILRDDLARHLESALGLLTDRERAVFVLKEIEGLETRQVARALGIARITVRRHLGLARARLRRALRGQARVSEAD